MDELIKRKGIVDKIDALKSEPAYQHTNEDWVNGLIMAEETVYCEPSVDAIPVQWMLNYIEENFWARCDVVKMIDAWHSYVKNNNK